MTMGQRGGPARSGDWRPEHSEGLTTLTGGKRRRDWTALGTDTSHAVAEPVGHLDQRITFCDNSSTARDHGGSEWATCRR